MATRYFDLTLSGDVNYIGERWWKGDDINKLWNLFNYNSDNRATWALDSQGWIQYRSAFGTYAGRYNTDDITLGDTYFETDLQAAGTGNYEVGFFMRFVDRYSFYYLTFQGGYKNWGTKNIRLYKVVGTTHTMVAEADSPVFVLGQTYKFRCELTGTNVKIYKDGTLIINWSDTSVNPYLKGAFGPWVLGQEFAKWRGFQAKNNSPFSVAQVFKNEIVTNDSYDPASSKLMNAGSVGTLLQDEVEAYMQTVPIYESWEWRSFRMSTTDSRVLAVFDRTAGKNTSQDPNSRIYVYQKLPTSPPLAPTNLVGIAVDTQTIKYTWSHADDSEDGFRIYDENDNLIATLGENVSTYTESGLEEATTYYRKVVAYNTAGESSATPLVTVRTSTNPPLAPTNFQGIAISDKKIRWSWATGSKNVQYYDLITWDANNNMIVQVTNIPGTATSYDEEGLLPSTRYVRAIRARNSAGISPESNPFEVTTQEELPTPPINAPVNFYGIGVSDTTIFWYWLDTNDDEDGFELLDKDDNVIAVIGPNQQEYLETGLHSLNVYQRKIRAYNKGGSGPETLLATAVTLAEGQDQTGKPLPPTDLRAEVLGTTQAKLTWQYEDDPHMPAVGFKLYMADGSFMHAIPVDQREHLLATLLPNTAYRLYLVAYNDRGESFKTNIVEFVTPHIIPVTPTPITPNDLEDPFYGVAYDEETLEMEKLSAFQSGIGDRLDLVVRNLQPSTPNLEIFTYEFYITGEYTHVFEGVKTLKIWESARVISNQNQVHVGETISFTEQIASPLFDVNWQEINAKFPISNYKLVYTSNNPNVNLYLEREITDFFPQGKAYIQLPMKARVINETQTAWYPSIHAGYYYLNQQEWFLYVDDKVQPKDGGIDTEYVLEFPYLIRANGGRHYDAQDFYFIDTTKTDFLQGDFDPNIDLNWQSGSMTLSSLSSGIFTSRMFRFGRPVTDWYNIEVDADEEALKAGASYVLQVGESDYLGNVVNWVTQTPGTPIQLSPTDKIKYRLILKEGFRKDTITPDYYLDNAMLRNGKHNRTVLAGNTLMLENPLVNLDGTYISPVIDLGEGIDDLGTLTLTLNIPGDGKVEFYSITSSDPNHDFSTPTADSPWIPLNYLYDPASSQYGLRIGSANKRYLAIVIKITRGRIPGPQFLLDKNTFNPSKAVNLSIDGDRLKLTDNSRKGVYLSDPIYVGDVLSVHFPLRMTDPTAASLIIQSVYGSSYDSVMNASRSETAWATFRPGLPAQPWIMFRVIINPTADVCAWIHHDKKEYADFIQHAGRTNLTIDQDGKMRMIDTTQKATYTSEIIEVAMLDGLNVSLGSTAVKGSKLYVKKMVDGVWQSEEVFNPSTSGYNYELSGFKGNNATHIQYRIEIIPQVLQPNDNEITYVDIRDADRDQTGTWHTIQNGLTATPSGYGDFNVRYNSTTTPSTSSFTGPWVSPIMTAVYDASLNWRMRRFIWRGMMGAINKNTYAIPTMIKVKVRTWDENGVMTEQEQIANSLDPGLGNVNGDMYKVINVPDALKFQFEVYLQAGLNKSGPVMTPYFGDVHVELHPLSIIPSVIDDIIVQARQCTPKDTFLEYLNIESDRVQSPQVSEIHVRPNLYKMTRVVPTIHEVRLGGHIKEGYALEQYAVPMWGELTTDFKEYPLTDKIVEDVVYEYLANHGILFDSDFQFTDYQLDVDPSYPVILRTSSDGLEKVFGKATQEAGDLLYKTVMLYFGESDGKISLRPIPQNGSPICIKNAAGQLLRPVHFRDQYGQPSLTNTEEPIVEYSRYLFLQHTGIDPVTLKVEIEIDGKYTVVDDSELVGDRVVLGKSYPSGTPARVSYRLMNSFTVHYNTAPDMDYCNIEVHTPYEAGNLESRKLEVKYETKKDTPYYLATEIDLNPLRTTVNSGFMYLTDTVYPPYSLQVNMNPNVLYRDRDDRVIITAIIQDEFGNPVVGEKADFTASIGGLQVIQRVSDMNGMVIAAYTSPKSTVASKATVNIQVISRDVTKQISKTVEIFFADSQSTNKIAILPEKNIVNPGDVVNLKVKVMGANDEPLAGRNVSLYADQGTLSATIGTTDAQGEVNLTYQFTSAAHKNIIIPQADRSTVDVTMADFTLDFELVNRYLESDITDGFLFIEAETYDDNLNPIREQILLGVNGV